MFKLVDSALLRRAGALVGAAALLSLTSACRSESPGDAPSTATQAAQPEDLRTRANRTFGTIQAPENVNEARAQLGARLYHDVNLSGDGTISCASCHSVADGGGDGARTSTGIGGQLGPINSPTTLNSHLNFVQFWDGRAATLEEQAAGPIGNPIEMGSSIDAVVAYLQSEPSYVEQFGSAFAGAIDEGTITTAIAEYERTLVTPNAPFDRWLEGDDSALSADARAGLELFMDTGCTACHMGPGLGGTIYQRMGLVHNYFERRGGELTEADLGRFNVTGNASERHVFKVPILRNIALTAPYFHDGAAGTLAEAVATMGYVQLGREYTAAETAQLVAFLESLTGEIPTVDLAELALPAPRTAPAEGEAPAAEGETATQK